MPRYLLSVHTNDETLSRPMTPEAMQQGFARIEAIEREMRGADGLVLSGRLLPAARAKVARPERRRVKWTDGPYVETKEHLGGFYVVEAADQETALDWAAKVSVAIDSPIEVRPFADEPPR